MKFAARCCALVSLGFAVSTQAAPITFNFVFNLPPTVTRGPADGGRYAGSPAAPQADGTPFITGSITFESTLLANPGVNNFSLPNPAVLALDVTVANAGPAGDGHFVLGDFIGVVFDTHGARLDLTRQLVGQPTSEDPWGTPSSHGGDFNLFSTALRPNAPNGMVLPPDGVNYFTLGSAGGNGPAAVLGSMAAATTAPALTLWALGLLIATLGFGAVYRLRRQGTSR